MSIFTKYTELDPVLEARQIEAAHGSPIFDKWSFLDPARFDAQAAAALGGTLDLPALLDPARARAELDALADTGGGGGGDLVPIASLDFIAGTYTVGSTSYAITDLLAGETDYFTTFSVDAITEEGLEGSTEAGGATPSIIGPLRDAIFREGGSSIVIKATGSVVSITISDGVAFQTFCVMEADRPDQHPSRFQFYPNVPDPIDTIFSGNALIDDLTGETDNLVGISIDSSSASLSVNGDVAEDASFDAFSFVHLELGVPYYCRSITVYAHLTDADLAALTALP